MPKTTNPSAPLEGTNKYECKFLKIPLEIRLHIYSYVMLSNPIQHAHLAPAPLSESSRQEIHAMKIQPLGHTVTNTAANHVAEVESQTTHVPLDSNMSRPPGKIPTGLLGSCSQIYKETKMLPWHENHLAFINWFWSGVYAATRFTRSLRPWQSEAIRSVSVEVLGRDLKEGTACDDWKKLCCLWRGVWKLNLCIKGSVIDKNKVANDGSDTNIENRLSQLQLMDIGTTDRTNEILHPSNGWVVGGLMKMKSLRHVVLDIRDECVPMQQKLQFCEALEHAMHNVAVKVLS